MSLLLTRAIARANDLIYIKTIVITLTPQEHYHGH